MSNLLDQRCVNTVRFLSADAVQQANSWHPGMPNPRRIATRCCRQRALALVEKVREKS